MKLDCKVWESVGVSEEEWREMEEEFERVKVWNEEKGYWERGDG